jgi:hypothetical protein
MEWQNSNQTHSTSTHYEDNPGRKKIWKLSVPPKQLHLIWRILNNAIHVKGKLLNRGIKCVPLCTHCNTSLETMDYVFLECDWTRKAWFASPLTIHIENTKINHIHD